jgi:hypothetical protein
MNQAEPDGVLSREVRVPPGIVFREEASSCRTRRCSGRAAWLLLSSWEGFTGRPPLNSTFGLGGSLLSLKSTQRAVLTGWSR